MTIKRKQLTELVIDRARWGMGWMLNERDGKMCCLGFMGKACGLTDADMHGIGSPSFISFDAIERAGWQNVCGLLPSVTLNSLMDINDDRAMPGPVKEARLTALFKEAGVALTFVGLAS